MSRNAGFSMVKRTILGFNSTGVNFVSLNSLPYLIFKIKDENNCLALLQNLIISNDRGFKPRNVYMIFVCHSHQQA